MTLKVITDHAFPANTAKLIAWALHQQSKRYTHHLPFLPQFPITQQTSSNPPKPHSSMHSHLYSPDAPWAPSPPSPSTPQAMISRDQQLPSSASHTSTIYSRLSGRFESGRCLCLLRTSGMMMLRLLVCCQSVKCLFSLKSVMFCSGGVWCIYDNARRSINVHERNVPATAWFPWSSGPTWQYPLR